MSPFHRLGVGRDADERDIKRAYAKALKVTRPDEDPVAFQALNEAYQAALSMVRPPGPMDAGRFPDGMMETPVAAPMPMPRPRPAPEPEPMSAPVQVAAPAPDFDLDAFFHAFTERCSEGRADALLDWLCTVEALYDIEFKHEVGAILHDWLLHDRQAPMLRSTQYDDLGRFFAYDFSSRLAPLTAARWALAHDKTTRYGERRPFAIRQLKRRFGWVRELLLGAVPGVNRRLGLLAWGLARDFGGIPPEIDQRQYHWYTRLADEQFLGRDRWLSIAAAALVWGVIIAGSTFGASAMAGEILGIGPVAAVGAIFTVGMALLLSCTTLYRWLRETMKVSERLGWQLGAGAPLALAVLAALATLLPDPEPAYLLGSVALIFAARHLSRIFDALRFYLASMWSLMAASLPDMTTPALALAVAATTFVALDATYAWRNSLPFAAAVGNRWVRIGSYAAVGTCLGLWTVFMIFRA